MNIQEKIESLEKQLAEVKALAEKQKEQDWKVGDWAVITNYDWVCNHTGLEEGDMFKVIRMEKQISGLWLFSKDTKSTACLANDCRKATPEEIEKHLTQEAEKRGFVVGVKFINANKQYIPAKHIETIRRGDFHYNHEEDILFADGNTCYHKGVWGEIVTCVSPQIKIGSYHVEFFEDHITVGCKSVHKSSIIKLKNEIKDFNESTHAAIIEGLVINGHTVGVDKLEEIAKHYEGGKP